jgi:glycerol uptake facilitator-like aquaporin
MPLGNNQTNNIMTNASHTFPSPQALAAEGLGTLLLLTIVVGSGIMGVNLAQNNDAIALLANAIATGTGLWVLINLFGKISGAHFNPVVSLIMWRRQHLALTGLIAYIGMQITGAILGVWLAHAMFDLSIIQFSSHIRTGPSQWFSESIATFGLLLTILISSQLAHDKTPALVACYVISAYWFTSSTSFANPAVTIARMLTNTFAGIAPKDVLGFICAQITGAYVAHLIADWFIKTHSKKS